MLQRASEHLRGEFPQLWFRNGTAERYCGMKFVVAVGLASRYHAWKDHVSPAWAETERALASTGARNGILGQRGKEVASAGLWQLRCYETDLARCQSAWSAFKAEARGSAGRVGNRGRAVGVAQRVIGNVDHGGDDGGATSRS